MFRFTFTRHVIEQARAKGFTPEELHAACYARLGRRTSGPTRVSAASSRAVWWSSLSRSVPASGARSRATWMAW